MQMYWLRTATILILFALRIISRGPCRFRRLLALFSVFQIALCSTTVRSHFVQPPTMICFRRQAGKLKSDPLPLLQVNSPGPDRDREGPREGRLGGRRPARGRPWRSDQILAKFSAEFRSFPAVSAPIFESKYAFFSMLIF